MTEYPQLTQEQAIAFAHDCAEHVISSFGDDIIKKALATSDSSLAVRVAEESSGARKSTAWSVAWAIWTETHPTQIQAILTAKWASWAAYVAGGDKMRDSEISWQDNRLKEITV